MAKKEPRPAVNNRHGDPVIIGIPAKHIDRIDDDGEVRLNDSGMDHVRALASEAAHAKRSGEADLAAGFRRDLDPYAITNTVSHSHAVYVDSVTLGTTTIIDATPVVGVAKPAHYLPSELATELDVDVKTIAKYAGLAELPPRPPARGKAKYSCEEIIAILRAFAEHSSGAEKTAAEKKLLSENQS